MKYRKGDFISPSSICKERHWYKEAMARMSPPPWIVEYQNSDIITFRWNRKDGTLGTSDWSEFDDIRWPQSIRNIDEDGDYNLRDCIGSWDEKLLDFLEEENE